MSPRKYFKLGSYSISILHYSLYHWDRRELVFLRTIRAYENLLAHYFGYEKDRQRMHAIWVRRTQRDPKYIFKYGQEHDRNFRTLRSYVQRMLPIVPKAGRDQIVDIFRRYWHLLYLAEPIGDINHTIDEIYTERISKKLRRLLLSHNKAHRLTEYLIALTTPWDPLPTEREELEFLKIAKRMKGGRSKKVNTVLERHLRKYEWIPVWYDNRPWVLSDLKRRLSKERSDPKISQRIRRLRRRPKEIKHTAQTTINELGIRGRLLQDIEALRYFTYIRTKVDLDTGFIVHKARPIYERMADLLGIHFEESKFLTPEEVIRGLQTRERTRQLRALIRDRQKFAVQVFQKDEQNILTGPVARELFQELSTRTSLGPPKEKRLHSVQEAVTGIGASLGTATGPARIIRSISGLHTMRDGEVLVVPSTSVDFVGAMKQSIAVVTEVGGITSHAAIVSRELGKPCVVNTLTATSFFKNGEIVEVDATRGIVRKVPLRETPHAQ